LPYRIPAKLNEKNNPFLQKSQVSRISLQILTKPPIVNVNFRPQRAIEMQGRESGLPIFFPGGEKVQTSHFVRFNLELTCVPDTCPVLQYKVFADRI
ncbi:MAG TPA: hypothetical protein PLK77_11935, partial [Pyrinomonadaceae bacterium]|nr:hypothetical protein [Pyrinomonadaceae bacterium]